jgi:hypothetical protein
LHKRKEHRGLQAHFLVGSAYQRDSICGKYLLSFFKERRENGFDDSSQPPSQESMQINIYNDIIFLIIKVICVENLEDMSIKNILKSLATLSIEERHH